jgi:hypothetical protein
VIPPDDSIPVVANPADEYGCFGWNVIPPGDFDPVVATFAVSGVLAFLVWSWTLAWILKSPRSVPATELDQ